MVKRIRITITLCLSFVFVTTVWPQQNPDSEKSTLIKRFLVLMEVRKQQEELLAELLASVKERLAQIAPDKTPEEIASMSKEMVTVHRVLQDYAKRVSTKFFTRFQQRVNLLEMSEKSALTAYDKHFTTAEIKDLIAFYESPTGQKLAKVMPQFTKELHKRLEDEFVPLVKQIMDEINEEEKDILDNLRSGEGVAELMRKYPPPPKTPKKKPNQKKR